MLAAGPDDLAALPLFEQLDDAARAAIAPWFDVYEYPADVRLIGEGAAGYSFFVLTDGSASVTIDGTEVRTLGAGDFFGELAILGDGHRSASVTTTSPARVLVMFGSEFRRLQHEYPQLGERIEAGVRERAS